MKSSMDFEEKSVEKAVQKACAELNIAPEKLKYDIISHGSSGIFGLVGAKKALIRVQVTDNQMATAATETIAPVASDAEIAAANREAVSALVDEAFGIAPAETERAPAPEIAAETKVVPQAEKTKTRGEGRRRTRTKAPKAPEAPEAQARPEAQAPPETETDQPMTDEAREATIGVAEALIRTIVDSLAAGAEVTVEKSRPGRRPRIHIRGQDAGMLIGKKGQNLEAIQYLVDKVVNKQCNQANPVVIDIEDYLESRKAELKELAVRMAQKAQDTGKPASINRMNAQDRRVVHMALKNNKAVRTQSVGSGYFRKLIIYPKKKAAQNQETSTE